MGHPQHQGLSPHPKFWWSICWWTQIIKYLYPYSNTLLILLWITWLSNPYQSLVLQYWGTCTPPTPKSECVSVQYCLWGREWNPPPHPPPPPKPDTLYIIAMSFAFRTCLSLDDIYYNNFNYNSPFEPHISKFQNFRRYPTWLHITPYFFVCFRICQYN